MAFLAGVQIPNHYTVVKGLNLIYGLGIKTSMRICYAIGINKKITFYQLTTNQRRKLQKHIADSYILQGALKKEIKLNINRLIENKSYKGKRHSLHLPVRGQRTRTNARTGKKLNYN